MPTTGKIHPHLYNLGTVEDLKLDSYLSLWTHAESNNLTEDTLYIPFDEDNWNTGGLDPAYTLVNSADITYDSGQGSISVKNAGKYFIYCSGPVYATGGDALVVMALYKDSTKIADNGTGVRIKDGEGPKDVAMHSVQNLDAGDALKIQVTVSDGPNPSDTVVGKFGIGWHFTMLRVNSVAGHVRYTSDADSTGTSSGNVDLYDVPANNGTIQQLTAQCTFDADQGAFQVDTGGTFMMFSALQFKTNDAGVAGGSGNHKFSLEGSQIDELSMGWHPDTDDGALTEYSMLKEGVAAGNKLKTRYVSGEDAFTAQAGSCFSIFKIGSWHPESGNGVTVLGSRIGFGCNHNYSDDFDDATADGGTGIFDEDQWGGSLSITETTAASDSDIVFVPASGRINLLASEPTDWFVSISVGMNGDDADTADGAVNYFRLDQGGDEIFRSYSRAASGESPENCTIAMIIRQGPDASYLVPRMGSFDGEIDDGTSISIFRLNNRIKTEGTPTAEIANDFTINNFNKDTVDKQYNRQVDQVPMKLGVRGPMSLRGRRTSNYSSDTPPNVNKGSKD